MHVLFPVVVQVHQPLSHLRGYLRFTYRTYSYSGTIMKE